MEEVDEFGIPIKKQATTEVAVDEFGIPVKKKELTTTTSQSSTEPVQQPVSQPIQPSKQNGTANLPPITLGAESLNAGQATTDATAQTAVSKPVGFETKEQRRQTIGQKSNEHRVAYADAILNYNTYESNIKDSKVKELEVLHNRLREAEEGRGIGEDAQYLKAQIELLGSQAVEPTLSALDQFGNPISKKAPYKTYGEMYEATKKAANLSTAQKETADKLQAELTPAIEAERKKENFQVDYKDENGNEYYKMNPMESFINGISGSIDVLDIGLQNISGNKPAALNAMKNKYVADNILFPKGTGDISATPSGALNAVSKLTEMGGGVVPLVAAGTAASSTGPLGVAAANALLFGAQDYGGTLYQAYSEEKTKNPDITDEEAMQLAESKAKFAGAKGAVLGGSMGLQGALGKSLFLNKAETSAFKTFMAEQSVMLPAFGTSTALQNLYEDKPIGEGVGQSMIDALIIGGMTHAVGAGMKMTTKLRGTFENAIAKNYGKLATTINDAVEAGTMDFATANSIAERAKAFDIVGKENPPKAEAKLVDLGIALNDVAQKAEEVKKANPLADTGELEAEAERINREIAETKGSPLSEKEQKEYEKLIEKRDKTATEGGEKPSLLQSEKDKIKHYEARIERAGKNEANSVAEGLGYDHAKHLLNDIEAKGLGKFETVQDVPKEVLEETSEMKKDEAIAAQQKKLGLPVTPETILSDEAQSILEKIQIKKLAPSDQIKTLTDELYKAYKALTQTRGNANRRFTREQIDATTKDLESKIEVLETVKALQDESGGLVTIDLAKEYAKTPEDAKRLVDKTKPFTRERQPQEVGETETIEAKQTETAEVVQEGAKVERTPQEEAVDFLDRHAVQGKIQKYDHRPDFGLSSEELTRGIKQIRDGKIDGAAAKKVLAKIEEWKAKGEVDMLAGGGGYKGNMSRVGIPYDFTVEEAATVNERASMIEDKTPEIEVIAERFTLPDGTLDKQRLAQEIEDAKGSRYFGDLLGFSEAELSNLSKLLKDESEGTTERGAEKSGSENNSGQEEKQPEEVAPVTEAPTAEADGGVKKTAPAKMKQSDMAAEGGEIKVGDYSVKAEAVEMPDGESGMNVTITKPNGEVVELGKVYSEDVASEVNKKLRGFALSETAQTPKEQTEQTPLKKAAEEITFEQAGSDRTGKIVSVDEKGNYKVKGNDGANYTVSPDKARTPEVVAEAKKSVADNLKKLQELSKPKTVATIMDGLNPKQAAIVPSEIVTVPMRLLGLGDKYIAAATKKIEDGVGRSFRAAMGNSNKALSRSASEAQGLFKMLALTSEDITKRRLGLGAMAAAPLKAVNFYKNAVDIVGKTPTSLRNVHQVLDPEVYTARGETPMDEVALSPAEKNLYDLLKSMNNMVHDWHYANGRITEETYLKNKDKYAPRFYEENEFEGYPDDLKASFEEYAKQQNFSYIKERKNFADVMADNTIIEDPVYGTAMRLAQMMRNEAVMDYAKDVNSRVKTYKEGDADIPNSYVQLKGGGQFGNINTYGELTNKYVPRDVAEDFKGYFFINEVTQGAYDVLKKYNRFAPIQWIKKSKTLYNPITQLGNIGSNYVFAMMNGIDPLTYQNRKFEAAKEIKEKGPLYLKLVQEGLLGTDITTKDLKEEAKPAPQKQGLRKAISDIDDKIQDFYGSRDEIAKAAAYLAHTKDYGRSEKDAIERVYSGFQNYNNVGRFYDFASKTPIIGNPYIKFKGDLVRIMKNNYAQRPLTNIAILASLNALAGAFSKWSNEDKDVKEARERRKFIPKIPMPKALGGDIPLVWQTKYGEINAARYFAPGSIYDMGEKTTPAEQISDYLPIQLTQTESGVPLPVKIQDPFLGPFVQLAFDKDFRGAPILDPEKTKWREGNATKEEKIQNAITFIARQDIPFFDKIDDANRAFNGEPDYYGRNKSLKQALLNNVLKVEQFEKPEVVASLTKEIDGKLHKMDALDKDIRSAKNLSEKNIEKINLRNITDEQKKALIATEYVRAQDKINEILNKQAQIKTDLLEPQTMLKKLGAPIPTGEDNSQRPKRPERPERPKR